MNSDTRKDYAPMSSARQFHNEQAGRLPGLEPDGCWTWGP